MAESERGYPGTIRDPFAPCDEFFEGADRLALLEQLQHLSKWTRRLLVVTGDHGAGKTTLFRRLSAGLAPDVRAARINATLASAAREVLEAVNQGFGVANPAGDDVSAIRDVVVDYVQGQSSRNRPCVVLVDDAHLLSSQALDLLLEVAHRAELHAVFFAQAGFVGALTGAIKRSEGQIDWHELPLPPLDAVEQREYLTWRLELAEYRGDLPFSDAELARIERQSGGLPGRIDELARQMLHSRRTGPAWMRFPRRNLVWASSIGAVAVAGYLVWSVYAGDGTAPAHSPPPAPGAVAPTDPSAAAPTASGALPSGRPAGSGSGARPVQGERPGDRSSAPSSGASAGGGALPVGTERAPSTNRSRRGDGSAPAPISDSVPSAAGEGAQKDSAGMDEGVAQPPAQASDLPVERPPQASGVAAAAQGATRIPPAGARDADWLLGQPGDNFTIQLLATASVSGRDAYVAAQRQRSDFASYSMVRGGETLYVVVYGSFPTREDAVAATRSLPEQVGAVRPWVRSLAGVQAAIRASR